MDAGLEGRKLVFGVGTVHDERVIGLRYSFQVDGFDRRTVWPSILGCLFPRDPRFCVQLDKFRHDRMWAFDGEWVGW